MSYKIAIAISIICVIPSVLFAQDLPVNNEQNNPAQGWSILDTGHIIVYYNPGANLKSIEAALRRRASYFSSDIPGEDAPMEDKIRYQLDALLRRAEEILDMRLPDLRIKIKIKIFRTRKELNDEYSKIFAATEDIKSFYIYKYNTIYVSEEDISDSVIAHEMGHAIIDHYFSVIPPEKVRELLASYVDLHLAD